MLTTLALLASLLNANAPELDDSEVPSVACEVTTHLDGRTVTTCEGHVTFVQDQAGNFRQRVCSGPDAGSCFWVAGSDDGATIVL